MGPHVFTLLSAFYCLTLFLAMHEIVGPQDSQNLLTTRDSHYHLFHMKLKLREKGRKFMFIGVWFCI